MKKKTRRTIARLVEGPGAKLGRESRRRCRCQRCLIGVKYAIDATITYNGAICVQM